MQLTEILRPIDHGIVERDEAVPVPLAKGGVTRSERCMDSIRKQLETLYDASGDAFFRCALVITRNAEMAEDAVHNAFQNAFKLTKAPKHLKAYLYRSVRNAAIDLVRKDARTEPLPADALFEVPPPQVDSMHRQEFIHDFNRALEKLSADERETIVQHLASHMTFQEIADLRERSMGTVTSWYRRGIEKLKLHLKDYHGPV